MMLQESYSDTLDSGCCEVFIPDGAVWPCGGCGVHGGDSAVYCGGTNHQWYPGHLDNDQCYSAMAQSSSWIGNICRGDNSCSFTPTPQGPLCQREHTMPEQWSHKQDTLRKTQNGSCPDRKRRDRRPWRVQGRGGAVRVRTVLTESQLRALLNCYSQTPRPDAMTKHRLGQLTGLSPRVIRVWFQNKRCKDKKRHALGKHYETNIACEPAGPMVVLSPDPPDFALQICVYESPWQPPSSHKDPPLTEMSPITWSSADLDSPQQHSHGDNVTLFTI